ncbi:MAG: SUMF1/EgtB/PvdO family nonheme iron enzyme [Armatimonadota bacterium]|nr:SUMF1/EgtB/PvdO family nonheme iron enzyme [Armatimonadota bacterium]
MKKVFGAMAVIALLCLCVAAHAVVMETVEVGNAGNTADTTGYGSVAYTYNIGKYEVTAGQYTEFLNAKAKTDKYGLYNPFMASNTAGCQIQRTGGSGSYTYSIASDYANRPVNYVSYWDACRFANWLGNGQGNGSTEAGAYTLNGYNWNDGHGNTIQRNANWKWAVTSEDEWYKAAYYDPNKAGGAGYWDYPTSSNTTPGRDMADASGNNANYYGNPYPIDSGKYTTVVGEFQNSDSPYGTFDQGGNIYEWNEAIRSEGSNYADRGLRGGSFYLPDDFLQASSYRYHYDTLSEFRHIGFRVSEVVPEPSSIIALAGGLVGLLGMRRRRA